MEVFDPSVVSFNLFNSPASVGLNDDGGTGLNGFRKSGEPCCFDISI